MEPLPFAKIEDQWDFWHEMLASSAQKHNYALDELSGAQWVISEGLNSSSHVRHG